MKKISKFTEIELSKEVLDTVQDAMTFDGSLDEEHNAKTGFFSEFFLFIEVFLPP